MKKILFIGLTFFISQLCFSQSTLYVIEERPTFNHNPSSECPIGDYTYDYDLTHPMGEYTITSNQVTVTVDFREGYNDDPSNGCNGPCGQFSWYCDGNDYMTEILNPFDEMTISYNGPYEITCTADVCLPINYYAILLPDLIQPTNNTRCKDELLFNQYSDGQNHDVNDLTWQYLNISNQWVDLPNYNSRYPLNVSIEEALGSNYQSLFSGSLQLRYVISRNNNSITSNIISFSIISCSPQLLSFTPQDAQCSYTDDGSFSMILDRDLEPGKKLVASLFYEFKPITNPNSFNLLDQKDTTTLIDNADGTYTYQWPSDTPILPGNYKVRYQTYDTTTPNPVWDSLEGTEDGFTISSPPPVTFEATKAKKVYCFGGSDGQIDLTASGDVGSFEYQIGSGAWNAFTNAENHTITGLSAGTYTIKVRDGNGCTERLGDGSDKTETITLTEPNEAVSLSLVNLQNTTASGFANGSITVDVDGGTPFGDGSYTFQWHDSANNLVTSTTTQNVASGYRITLNSIGADTYTLTVTDAYFSSTTTQAGCTFTDVYTVTEPPPLSLSIQESNVISCNSSNTFGNPSADGELTAIASGGVPFDPLIDGFYAYIYTWKKKDASGVWQTITGETTDTLSDIDAGEYAVNIEDANGIIVGTYTNNGLTTTNDVQYTLTEPDLLQVSLAKTDVFCHNGSDGTITTTITGGTGNYTVSWNTGATSQNLTGLTAGTYTISVTDEKGCQTQATMAIEGPANPIAIGYTFFAPTFAGATNGWIKATIMGGTPLADGSYTFLWEDASNTNLVAQVTPVVDGNAYELTLNDIGEGTYFLTIEDANHTLTTDNANCTIIESDYLLEDPEPLSATISIQTPISCNSSNTYSDPFSDGVLACTAEGGVQLQATDNNGLPYYYTWKKETSPGVWTVLSSQTTDVATGLGVGNYAVNVEDANGIIIGTYVNNVLVTPTDVTFQFNEPPLLELSLAKQDVYCHLGSDGWAEATITGGTPPYTTTWSNGDTTLLTENLSAGNYSVAITDSRGCQVDGSIEILQPEDPIEITYTAFSRPSTSGASDGWVEAQIIGGTALADGSYTYAWTDDTGTSLNGQTATSFVGASNDIFQIRLNDIPSGAYYLTIEDANYSSATTEAGCTVIDSEFIIYNPIEATIAVFIPISCNQNNTFDNPYADGQLLATVTGGLPFATGQPYIYHWKKQDTSGNYIDLPSQTSDIAVDLSTGNYALNVEDSLGNVIGIYDSFTLVQATDVLFTFDEPELLEVSLSSTEINCAAGNDGTATVNINGGIPPYGIQWSNGGTTPTIDDLIAGTYLVYVIDARGCEATGQVTVSQPGGLDIEITQETDPTCYLGNDGAITVNVTGGQTPYTYLWNTGDTTTGISSLTEGTYTFQVTDANSCIAFVEIILVEPDPIIVDLGEDRTLCNDQAHDLDISIDDSGATYQWTSDNGFSSSSPAVALTEAGTYTATLTTGLGCIGTDTLVISSSTVDIDSQFLITSQAFAEEEVILVNTSNPISENVQWFIPNEATIVDQSDETITLRFDFPGAYEITLRSFQGNCFQDFIKPIIVEEARDLPDMGDADAPFIIDFVTYPNPTTGVFEVDITLQEETTVSLRLFSLVSNVPVDDRQAHNASEYNIDYNINLASGIYFLLLETAKGSEIRRIIIE